MPTPMRGWLLANSEPAALRDPLVNDKHDLVARLGSGAA